MQAMPKKLLRAGMSISSLVTNWLRPKLGRSADIVVCIYTCEKDRIFLGDFYSSIVGTYLLGLPRSVLLEVYANPKLKRPLQKGKRLLVPAEERYGSLSLKTYEMIRYCVEQFRFHRLFKIDVTVMRTSFPSEYKNREPVDLDALVNFLRTSDPTKTYDGLRMHASVPREVAESWASIKGLTIDYQKVFGTRSMPPYFSGKCYVIGRSFAEYITVHGAEFAREHAMYFPGAEDVMIGRMYQAFEKASP